MKAALFRFLYLFLRLFRPTQIQGAQPTVLILQYQMPLGCCVHETPLNAALKFSGTSVIVATRGLGAATLQHDPYVDHLLLTGDPTSSLREKWRVARQIRRELRARGLRVTRVITDASSRAGSHALLAAMLRLAPTAGFANAPQLYDEALSYDRHLSLIDNNLRLAPTTAHREPKVYFTPRDLAFVRDLLPERATRVAFVLQGSGGQSTGWHNDRAAATVRYVESLGCGTVFFGTAADGAVIGRIMSMAQSTGVSLAGKTSVAQLAATLCLCDLLVSIDTGTMHVGRAVDVPMVVLGPSWQKPLEWLPLGRPNVRILRGSDIDKVPANYHLDEVEAADVKSAVDELLASYPASAASREIRARDRLSNVRV